MFTSLALAHMVAALAKRGTKAIYSDGAKVWVIAANYLGIQCHHVSHQILGIFSCHVRLGCSFQKSLRSWHAVMDNGRVWHPFCIMTLEDFVLLSRWAARVFKAHGLQSASNMQWFWPTFLPAWNRQFWHYLLLHFQNISQSEFVTYTHKCEGVFHPPKPSKFIM